MVIILFLADGFKWLFNIYYKTT